MKNSVCLIVIFQFCVLAIVSGQILRFSDVKEEGDSNVEPVVLKAESYEETLFIAKESVVSDDDIEDVIVDWGLTSPGNYEAILKITKSGGDKLKSATESRIGRRMAIIVEGIVVMAPVINGVLQKSITISTSNEEDFLAIVTACEKLLGKTLPRAPIVVPGDRGDARLPKTVAFTEDEYLARKALREKAGIFYLEKLPPKSELKLLLVMGASERSVITALGKPSGRTKFDGGIEQISYEIAPEKRKENGARKMLRQGIGVTMNDGKVSTWDYSYSDQTRERKLVEPPKRILAVILPESDFSAEEFDMIDYLEKIEIPDIDQEVSEADLYDILTMIANTASVVLLEDSDRSVKRDCDILKFFHDPFS